MNSKRVVQGFFFNAWRYGPLHRDVEPVFHEDRTHFDVTATGPYLHSQGHIQTLALLKTVISPWVAQHLENRLLVPGDDKAFLARVAHYTWPKPPVILPCADTACELAKWLLTQFSGAQLREEGCLVTQVAVRCSQGEPYVATVSEEAITAAAWVDPDPKFHQRPRFIGPTVHYSASI